MTLRKTFKKKKKKKKLKVKVKKSTNQKENELSDRRGALDFSKKIEDSHSRCVVGRLTPAKRNQLLGVVVLGYGIFLCRSSKGITTFVCVFLSHLFFQDKEAAVDRDNFSLNHDDSFVNNDFLVKTTRFLCCAFSCFSL
jgi:hypothetical protein